MKIHNLNRSIFKSVTAFLFLLLFTPSFGQTVTGTMAIDVTHNTCNLSNSTIAYSISLTNIATGTSAWNKFTVITTLRLYYDNQVAGTSDLVMDHVAIFGNKAQTGNRSNLATGHYYFNGSITTRDYLGNTVSVPILVDFWVGYKTQWDNLNEMVVGTTPYSILRNSTASTNTFGWAQSFNTSTTNRAWIEIKKKSATTYPSTLYCVLDPITNLSAFTATGNFQYIEFIQTAANTGTIKLKYWTGSVYTTATLSTNITDKIRVIRSNSNTCTINLNQSVSNVAPAFSVTGTLKVSVFAKELNTEALDVVSAFPCAGQSLTTTGFSNLKRELDGGHALTVSGTLKFYFEEEYKMQAGKFIPLKVYGLDHQIVASVAFDGTLGGSANAAMKLPYEFDDNRKSLSLTSCGLTVGQYYILEVETSTKEKRFLKFKYIN